MRAALDHYELASRDHLGRALAAGLRESIGRLSKLLGSVSYSAATRTGRGWVGDTRASRAGR